MRRDERVFVIGEDVGVYGGAFKVTQGFQAEFGAVARARRAAGRDGDRRRLHRRLDDGHAAGRRDAVRRLHLVRLGPPRHGRRQAALPHRRRAAVRRPLPLRRRLLRRPVPLAEPRVVVRAHPRPEARLPGHAGGREGPPDRGHPRPEPGPLLRAQAPLPPDQGRGARRRLHDPVRQGARPPRGLRPDDRDLGRDGLHRRRGRRRRSPRRTAPRSRCSTCARSSRGTARPCWRRWRAPRSCSCCTRTRAPPASAPRSRPRSPRRRSSCSTRPAARLAAPDTPVPFSPPLEKAFIPQVDDVVQAIERLAAY